MIELKPGTKLRSAVCTTEVIIVKAPTPPVEVSCGGAVMGSEIPGPDQSPDGNFSAGTLLGKRYVHPDSGLEVLCTKGGEGSLTVAGVVLSPKEAKPLPASD